MKFIPILSLCTSFACVFAGPITQRTDLDECQGFSSSCESISVKQDGNHVYLSASCADSDAFYGYPSKLDLNQCIGSVNGALAIVDNGNFSNTCSKFKYSKSKLSAECGNGHRSELKLDDYIGNSRGVPGLLCCFGHLGDLPLSRN